VVFLDVHANGCGAAGDPGDCLLMDFDSPSVVVSGGMKSRWLIPRAVRANSAQGSRWPGGEGRDINTSRRR